MSESLWLSNLVNPTNDLKIHIYATYNFWKEGRGCDSRWGHWDFSLTYSFRPHYDPGVDSACNRNEYQEYLRGVKMAGE
jgi:hypothetical protein